MLEVAAEQGGGPAGVRRHTQQAEGRIRSQAAEGGGQGEEGGRAALREDEGRRCLSLRGGDPFAEGVQRDGAAAEGAAGGQSEEHAAQNGRVTRESIEAAGRSGGAEAADHAERGHGQKGNEQHLSRRSAFQFLTNVCLQLSEMNSVLRLAKEANAALLAEREEEARRASALQEKVDRLAADLKKVLAQKQELSSLKQLVISLCDQKKRT